MSSAVDGKGKEGGGDNSVCVAEMSSAVDREGGEGGGNSVCVADM